MRERRPGLPHVTDILADAGLIDTEWFHQYDLDRGSAVHKATELLDLGDLDWASVDSVILGRLRSYQRFKDEVNPTILAIEEKVTNAVLQYEGKLDRRIKLRGTLGIETEGILDIKGPSRAPWQALQVGMYAACFPRPMRRWTLHLSDDKYNLIEYTDREDWAVAKAAITLAAWRLKHEC